MEKGQKEIEENLKIQENTEREDPSHRYDLIYYPNKTKYQNYCN